jgi:rhamnopyranosyl-N-acetylglucosaminyl-diphospho-decaprenol beta-1,3/1,4-galactofuranosyltransferase
MRKQGARIPLIRASRVRHPLPRRRLVTVFGIEVQVLEQAAWKRYYEIRNRLIVARRHHGFRLWTETLPGTLLRWLVMLAVQPNRLGQSAAYARGIVDGLTGRLGMRWPPP